MTALTKQTHPWKTILKLQDTTAVVWLACVLLLFLAWEWCHEHIPFSLSLSWSVSCSLQSQDFNANSTNHTNSTILSLLLQSQVLPDKSIHSWGPFFQLTENENAVNIDTTTEKINWFFFPYLIKLFQSCRHDTTVLTGSVGIHTTSKLILTCKSTAFILTPIQHRSCLLNDMK